MAKATEQTPDWEANVIKPRLNELLEQAYEPKGQFGDLIMVVFHSVADALNAGFQIYDRTNTGYLVRTKTSRGWALALIELRK